jgi:MoxR-like ATPase
MDASIERVTARVREEGRFVADLQAGMSQVIVGQKHLVDRLVISLLANGHVLLEGVPGLAKTLAVRTLAALVDVSFQRIQFTPDLLPADLVGTLVYNPREATFTTRKGPVFANLILADEINRAPAKVQSALLEAMQERQVTIGQETFPLPKPFLVLATQNPIEQEGTYPLPEAQVDRFMLKVRVDYPTLEEERRIMDAMSVTDKEFRLQPVVGPDAILRARQVVDAIYLDPKVKEYILAIVFATRHPERYNLKLENLIRYGASPRASLYLALTAKAHAFLNGRGYVTPQDVKSMAPDVLRHRVIVSYEAESEELTSDDLVARVLDGLPVP